MNQKYLETISDMEEDKHISKTMIPINQMHSIVLLESFLSSYITHNPFMSNNTYVYQLITNISNFITLPIKNLLNCNLPLHQWCTISYINFPLNHVKTWGIVRWKSRLMIHQSFFIYFIWQIKNEVNQPQILPCS